MPILDDVTLTLLENEFRKNLKKGTTLEVLACPHCTLCNTITLFLKKICDVSKGKIKMHEKKDMALCPGIRILDNLVYRGMPTGTQTGPFLHFLIDNSNGTYFCGDMVAKEIRAIKDSVTVDVYISPACPLSPLQVRWAYEFASLNKNIKVKIVDCVQLPELAIKYGVGATPKTVINGRISITGQMDPDEFLRKIKHAIETEKSD